MTNAEPGRTSWPIPVVEVVRDGNHVYTAEGQHIMNAYVKTARREVERLTEELGEAVAALQLLEAETAADPTPAQVLDLETATDAGEGTVRNQLVWLLEKVWAEREGFNGKRPWGNSGWEWDFYRPMIDAGFLVEDEPYPHLSREHGVTLSADQRRKGDRLIMEAIKTMGETGGTP